MVRDRKEKLQLVVIAVKELLRLWQSKEVSLTSTDLVSEGKEKEYIGAGAQEENYDVDDHSRGSHETEGAGDGGHDRHAAPFGDPGGGAGERVAGAAQFGTGTRRG